MPRPKVNAPLNVFVNGRLVGVLKRESSGAIDFRYDAQWLSWQSTFPISLSLPFAETFETAFNDVLKTLPGDFPEQLTSSIRTAALHRTSLIAEA